MSEYLHKRHNVSVLLYHIVCPTKYRRAVIGDPVEDVLREVCIEISKRYEINVVELGIDSDHVHYLVQSVPMYSPTKIVRTIKSLTAREVFSRLPQVKKQLWGGEFWSKGYFITTVGRQGDENMIRNYVQNQGQEYEKLLQQQLELFPDNY